VSSAWSDIRADVARYSRGPQTRFPTFLYLLRHYGLRATATYRLGKKLLKWTHSPAIVIALPLWPVYWIGAALARHGYGIHLSLTADIGPGLYIGHLGGICLANCSLGPQCSIGQQTKIGSLVERQGPRIGSRVWIGAHSKISGAVVIEDGATIGAGARVTADVSARTLVMGDPARAISRNYDNTSLLLL
jgi:serine O-acetyltransferase